MKLLTTTILLLCFAGSLPAEETMSEKAEVKVNSAKRTMKKGMNRTKEAVCGKLTGDNKVECLAEEAKNRMGEVTDSVSDKASEIKNNVDSDKK